MNPELFYKVIDNYMLQVTKVRPCIVTAVNYVTNTVDVQPLIKTRYTTGQETFAPSYDVPLMVYSGVRGNARITVPVAVGDNVVVLYSDRDVGPMLSGDGTTASDSGFFKAHMDSPILAIPCFFPNAVAKPIDSQNIVIENNGTSITVTPDGNVNVVAGTKVYVNTPLTQFTGNVVIDQNLHVKQHVTVDGNEEVMGSFTVHGKSTGKGSLEIDGTITSHSDVISAVSLNGHTHACPDGATSGPR